MIVDHLPKINVIRPESANDQRRHRPLSAGLLIGLITASMGLLCQSSSAQETANSTKSTTVAKKDARKVKRFVALGRFESKKITESSGIATAREHADGSASDAIWTFNDSGGDPILFRVSTKNDATKGHTEATLKLKGAKNRDWESMCGFAFKGDRFLAVGDIGDNQFRQKKYKIYVAAEPLVEPKISKKGKLKTKELKAKASTIEFKYEDGPHNCEAMAYNSQDDSFWFVEKVYVDNKRRTAPGIYVMPNPIAAIKTNNDTKPKPKPKPKNIAKRIADFPVRNVTGMAFSPDNQRLVIRSYFGAWLFEKTSGKTWQDIVNETKAKAIPLPLQSQGEAICFGVDGNSFLVTSEFSNAIIWQVNFADKSAGKVKDEDAKKK